MKKTFIYSMLFTTIFLTGCEQPHDPMKEFSTKSVEKPSINETVTQATQNIDPELNEMVKKLQLEDPTIVDAYYSFDENGEKILNIVKEDSTSKEGSSGLSTFMWAMAGGLTANMLFNSLSQNKGNMNSVSNQYKPLKRYSSSYDTYKQDKMIASNKSSLQKTNKLTPVDTTKKVAPLSKNAYRDTNVSQKPKTITKTVKTKKTSYFKKSFKRSLFKRR